MWIPVKRPGCWVSLNEYIEETNKLVNTCYRIFLYKKWLPVIFIHYHPTPDNYTITNWAIVKIFSKVFMEKYGTYFISLVGNIKTLCSL